jgi:transketolase
MEIVKKVHARNLVKLAADKPEVVVLSADLTSSTEVDLFRDTYKDRFFSMGIAEQNMLSFAGGMAREGFVPYIHTFAVFIYRRAYDQIAMSVAYPNLPVRMVGFLPGITTPGGATHQAIEDIAIMRALPNMTIVECADATEIESVLDAVHGIKGPVYIRMLRGEVPRLFDKSAPFQVGSNRKLRDGNDLVIITSGICTEEAMRALPLLDKAGVSIAHFHVSTLKPFFAEDILKAVSNSKHGVITLENHSIVGGLGTILAEQMADNGIGKKLYRLGIPDTFVHGASRHYLMKEYGLDAMALTRQVEAVTGTKTGITREMLGEVHIEAVHSTSKAEAL